MSIATDRATNVIFKDLPHYAGGYARWRYGIRSAVLSKAIAMSMDPSQVNIYIQEIDDHALITFDDLARLDVTLIRIDVLVFDAVQQCLKGQYCDKFLELIEARCSFGCGRQAIRVLDAAHRHDLAAVRAQAAQEIVRAVCPTLDDLQTYLSHFRVCISPDRFF